MPLNLLKKYNDLLDLGSYNEAQRKKSLHTVFERDFCAEKPNKFRSKEIQPTPADGKINIETLFTHLTTVITDDSIRQRTFDLDRSVRLHWVKFHLEEKKQDEMLWFSVQEPNGLRTYIYDKTEKYVIVLEPLREIDAYYLLTAYHLKGKDAKRNKIIQKYKRKLNDVV